MRRTSLTTLWLMGPILLLTTAGVIRDTLHDSTKNGADLFERQKYQEALESFGRGREVAPDHPVLAYDIGNTLLQLGKMDEALQEYHKALRTDDPRLKSRVYYNMGTAALQKQMPDKAVEYLRESLLLDPTQQDAKRNLELALRQEQQQQQEQQQEQQDPSSSKEQQPQQGDSDPSDSREQNNPPEPQRPSDQNQSSDSEPQQLQQDPSSQESQSEQNSSKKTSPLSPERGDQDKDRSSAGSSGQEDQSSAEGQKMDPVQAQRLLQALAAREKKELERLMRSKASSRKKSGKDW